jgi:LPXTG-motif cell wall-anchored protein
MGSTQTTDGSADSGTACGFDPGENVRADGASVPVFLGSTIASASGRATVHFTIPADFPAGLHHLIMTGQTSGHTVIQAFTVTAAGASAPASSSSSGSSLPFTGGNDVWQMTLAGVVLVGVGGSLLVVRRRRTHAAAV